MYIEWMDPAELHCCNQDLHCLMFWASHRRSIYSMQQRDSATVTHLGGAE